MKTAAGFLCCLLTLASGVKAQTMSQCVASRNPSEGHWFVTCSLSSIDNNSVSQLKAYVFDPSVGQILASVLSNPSPDGFDLNVQQELDKDQVYFVFAQGLTSNGKPPDTILNAKLKFNLPQQNNAQPTTNWQTFFKKFAGAPSKEKSDFYFAGEIWTVAGQDWDWAGSVDLKLQAPFRVGETRFDHQISPFVTLQLSNDPSADPDSLKFGGAWTGRLLGVHDFFKGLYGKQEIRIEADRSFTDENFISDSRFTVELPSIVSKSKTFHGYLEPFVGVEAGKNLKAPLSQVDGTGRARPMAGASFALTFTKIPRLKALSFTSDYARRWPLLPELGFKADANNVLQLTQVGTSPKDRVVSKINFMFTDWLGAYFGHEYGSEPPDFKLVDNKLTTGLLIQAKFGSSR